MATNVFTPASLDAFKRTARDVQTVCGNPLNECQEALAKAYGYHDLHAVQEHLKTHPASGPRVDEDDFMGELHLRMSVPNQLRDYLKPRRWGRINLHDLGLLDSPEVRAKIMREHRLVDDLLEGRAPPEHSLSIADYLWFDDDRDSKRGSFRRTPKSEVIHRALVHVDAMLDGLRSPAREMTHEQVAADSEHIDSILDRIADLYPNSPYAQAAPLLRIFDSWDDELPDEVAAYLWPRLQKCRAMFDQVVPHGFRREIEPEPIGDGIDNYPYIKVLFCGAACAMQLGNRASALAWARRGRTLNKNDSFGFRFIVAELTGAASE